MLLAMACKDSWTHQQAVLQTRRSCQQIISGTQLRQVVGSITKVQVQSSSQYPLLSYSSPIPPSQRSPPSRAAHLDVLFVVDDAGLANLAIHLAFLLVGIDVDARVYPEMSLSSSVVLESRSSTSPAMHMRSRSRFWTHFSGSGQTAQIAWSHGPLSCSRGCRRTRRCRKHLLPAACTPCRPGWPEPCCGSRATG